MALRLFLLLQIIFVAFASGTNVTPFSSSDGPVLSVDSTVTFRSNYLTYTDSQTVTIRNIGSAELIVSSISVSGSRFSVDTSAFNIAAGDSVSKTVFYQSQNLGTFSETMRIHSNDTIAPITQIALSGTTIEPPIASVNQTSFTSTLATGDSSTHTLTLNNSGNSDLDYNLFVTHGKSVLIIAGDYNNRISDVQNKLVSTGRFSKVDVFNAVSGTPTLDYVRLYDAVLIWRNNSFSDGTALGNILADYVDNGGGVVTALFEISGNSLGGRWRNDNYRVFSVGQHTNSSNISLGTIEQPNHPIMKGVSSFKGRSTTFHLRNGTLLSDATRVASWSNGEPLVGTRKINGVTRESLSFYPV